MVRKQRGRIQWSGWGIRCPGLQLNRTRPNSFTSLRQPPAPTLLQHSSRPVTTGPKRTRPFPPWSPIHWWVSSTAIPEPINSSACVLTSCPCSAPHSDGDAAETPGVCQLHWIARTGHFRQPHILGWAKRLESSLMASAVSKHCFVQLICTSCFLQKVWECSGRGTLKNIQVKADKILSLKVKQKNRSCQIWARFFFALLS